MRVLHISNDYYNSEVYRTLHHGFMDNGVDSVFFVPMCYSDEKHVSANVVQAHCFHKWDRFLYMNKQRKIYKTFREAVKAHKPEINHGLFLYSGGIHCLWAKREFGIPYVVTVQNTDLNTIYRFMPHLRELARRILREASAVIFVSESYMKFVLEHVVNFEERTLIADKCRLLPFAVNPFWTRNADTTRHSKHEGPVRLLTVGTINKSKNQLGTIKAVQLLRTRGIDIELTVIGTAEDTKIDRKIAEQDFVRRIHYLQKEELIEEYRKADVFVLPSFTESFGLVYAEALTQGLPVIYSAGQGFDHQFLEGTVGYHVDARSPEDIANGICRVLREYDDLQGNCSLAVERFAQNEVCAQCERFYREIVAYA